MTEANTQTETVVQVTLRWAWAILDHLNGQRVLGPTARSIVPYSALGPGASAHIVLLSIVLRTHFPKVLLPILRVGWAEQAQMKSLLCPKSPFTCHLSATWGWPQIMCAVRPLQTFL